VNKELRFRGSLGRVNFKELRQESFVKKKIIQVVKNWGCLCRSWGTEDRGLRAICTSLELKEVPKTNAKTNLGGEGKYEKKGKNMKKRSREVGSKSRGSCSGATQGPNHTCGKQYLREREGKIGQARKK